MEDPSLSHKTRPSSSNQPLSKQVSFSDFITYFHKLSHENLSLSDVKFTMKKRPLVTHLCNNLHAHLLREVLDGYLQAKTTLM